MPIFLLFLRTYWQYIAITAVVGVFALFIWSKGVASARRECEAEKEKARAELQGAADRISSDYETNLGFIEYRGRTINREMEAEIAKNPIYHQCVIPDNGLRIIRDSVSQSAR